MVASYGMSEELGPVTIGEKEGEVFLGASLQELGSVGPATLELIDREVERIVKDSVAQAEEILGRNWGAVYETANALIEHETLSGHALDAVLSTVQPTLLDLGEQEPPPALPEAQPQEEGAQEPGE
jgi:cell division protease FtsH